MINTRTIDAPVFFLSIFVVFTFIPVLYTYMPFFGSLRVVLLAGFGLLFSYVFASGRYGSLHAWKNPLYIVLVLFLITMISGLMVSLDRGKTLEITKMCLRYMVVVTIMVRILDNSRRLDFILKIFAICGFFMALHTITNYFFVGYTFKHSVRGAAVVSGIFADPNDLAQFLCVVLPVLFYFYAYGKRKKLFLIAIVTVIAAIVLTYSRGGLLGLIVVYAGLIVFRKKERKKLVAFGLLCALVFIPFLPEDYKERISTITTEARVDPETGKYPGRAQAWVELTPVGFSESPFLGAGAGNSYYLAGKYYGHWGLMHNSFLQAFLELGIIGFVFFTLLFVLPFRQYRTVKARSTEDVKADVGRYQLLLVSLLSFAVTGFFLPQTYSVILFFLIGLLVAQNEQAVPQRLHQTRESKQPLEKRDCHVWVQ